MNIPSPQPSSPIFHLPGELRNQIYRHLLGHNKTISVYRVTPPSSPGPLVPKPKPTDPLLGRLLPIFLSCRALSLEARTWFYSHNAFFFPSPSSLDWPTRRNLNSLCRTFLDCIGERNAELIRHLCVPFPLDDPDAFDRWYEAPLEFEGRLLFPGLAARVPGLRVLEFVTGVRTGMALETHLGRYDVGERRGLIGRIDEALREEFPRLRRVVVDVEGEGEEGVRDVEGWNGWATRRQAEVEGTRWKVMSTLGRERLVVEDKPVVLVRLPRRTRWKWNVMRGVGMEVSDAERRKFFDDWRPLG
ncbi:hypothetical protein B0T16DRAFT_419721 [Cercophora newfieldiana]|uniref:Uncharacterized protein n=1 Tax=Cercophora newfieldiana TaxID=92897 RepID=A0AA39XXF8_9PEZI|nr:hypothetical protein B0T16DRAFT_419721 [Cercophora newfieldiana]